MEIACLERGEGKGKGGWCHLLLYVGFFEGGDDFGGMWLVTSENFLFRAVVFVDVESGEVELNL